MTRAVDVIPRSTCLLARSYRGWIVAIAIRSPRIVNCGTVGLTATRCTSLSAKLGRRATGLTTFVRTSIGVVAALNVPFVYFVLSTTLGIGISVEETQETKRKTNMRIEALVIGFLQKEGLVVYCPESLKRGPEKQTSESNGAEQQQTNNTLKQK